MLEYEPRPHGVHNFDDALTWNVPAGHVIAAPVPAEGQYDPGGHAMHVSELVAPSAVEYVPGGHDSQSDGDEPPIAE